MSQESMAQHHLRYSNSATPSYVTRVSDLQRSGRWSGQHTKPITNCFLISLEQWSEAFAITQPNERVELLLEPLLLHLYGSLPLNL